MDNLWLLTEERPKPTVILQIIQQYCTDFHDTITTQQNVRIKPLIEHGIFQFVYAVEGLSVGSAANIFIKTVSGNSSFLDFLLFKQENAPAQGSKTDHLLMAIEETKTSDDESRNTGVYQRGSKFVYIAPYYSNVRLYMLYNDELNDRKDKKPSATSIFGTNLLLTLGVAILGKDTSKWFQPFSSLDELIQFKTGMRRPPASNVPLSITQYPDRIELSGRLSKPANAGNIGHDPNIGALSMIAQCIRRLGWDKDIVITQHGVTQAYVDRTRGKNKFLYICHMLGLTLDSIVLPSEIELPKLYWHYEMSSEKMTSILLHVLGIYSGMHTVYENHAGCERGYFWTQSGTPLPLPKKDRHGNKLYLPDVVLYDKPSNTVLLIEGKKLATLRAGIEEIQFYDSIEEEYIKPHYPGARVLRCVSIFGGSSAGALPPAVLIYMNLSGEIFINPNAPECVKTIFRTVGVNI